MTATVLALPSAAFAHDPGLSVAELELRDDQIRAEIVLARADLSARRPRAAAELEASEKDASSVLAKQLLTVLIADADGTGRRPAPLLATTASDQGEEVRFTLSFARTDATHLRLTAPILERLPRGHRMYLRLRAEDGALLVEALLDRQRPTVEAELGRAQTTGTD